MAATGHAAPFPVIAQRAAIVLAEIGMGSGLSLATIHTLARYPVSIFVLAVALATMTATSFATLRRWPGISGPTAFCAAVPARCLTSSSSPRACPPICRGWRSSRYSASSC